MRSAATSSGRRASSPGVRRRPGPRPSEPAESERRADSARSRLGARGPRGSQANEGREGSGLKGPRPQLESAAMSRCARGSRGLRVSGLRHRLEPRQDGASPVEHLEVAAPDDARPPPSRATAGSAAPAPCRSGRPSWCRPRGSAAACRRRARSSPFTRLHPPLPDTRGSCSAKTRCGSRWFSAAGTGSSPRRTSFQYVPRRGLSASGLPQLSRGQTPMKRSTTRLRLRRPARPPSTGAARSVPRGSPGQRLARLPARLQICGLERPVVGVHRHRQPPAVGAQRDDRGVGHVREHAGQRQARLDGRGLRQALQPVVVAGRARLSRGIRACAACDRHRPARKDRRSLGSPRSTSRPVSRSRVQRPMSSNRLGSGLSDVSERGAGSGPGAGGPDAT